MQLDSILLTIMMAGTVAYAAYQIEKRREDIRKTIQVIDLKDNDFWEGLTEYRTQAMAKA